MEQDASQRRLQLSAQCTALICMQLFVCALMSAVGASSETILSVTTAGVVMLLCALFAMNYSWKKQYQLSVAVFLMVSYGFALTPIQFLSGNEHNNLALLTYLLSLLALPLLLPVCTRIQQLYYVGGIVFIAQLAGVVSGFPNWQSLFILSLLAGGSLILRWSQTQVAVSQKLLSGSYFEVKGVSQAWQCLMLQASVLLLLLFTDLLRGSTSVVPIQLKLLGLAALIVSAYLMIGVRRSSVELRMTLSTLLVGTVVSLSTLWSEESFAFYAALPTLYILGLTSVFHWAPLRHASIVAWLALIDVFLRLSLPLTAQNRAALVFVCLGGVVAIAGSRLRYLYHTQDPRSLERTEHSAADTTIARSKLRYALLATQLHRVVLWQRVYAAAAMLLCAYLIARHAPSSFWIVLSGVFLLVGIQLLIEVLLQRERSIQFAWVLSFCSFVVSALWSGVALLYFSAAEVFYIYWAVTVTAGIALCPWRLHELFTLALVAGILLIESIQPLGLGSDDISAVLVMLCAGFLISRTLEQALRVGVLSRIGFRSIHESTTVKECESVLSEILLMYCNAHTVFFSSSYGGNCQFSEEEVASSQESVAEVIALLDSEIEFETVEQPRCRFASLDLSRLGQKYTDVSFLKRHQERALVVELRYDELELPYTAHILLLRPLPFLSARRYLRTAEMLIDANRVAVTHLLDFEHTQTVRETMLEQDALREYELSAMVHDINNTVQDLTLLCESIRDDVDVRARVEDVVEEINLIEHTARAIAHIVSDAKRRRELEQLEDLSPRELVELGEAIADVIVFAKLRAERKAIQIEVDNRLSENCRVRVSVREHLEAVLRNLVQNAIAYSSSGSVVRVVLSEIEEDVVIDVEDNGIGLTSKELEQVFSPGYRGRVRDSAHGGLGLGLAQSRRVITAAGGSLTGGSAGPGEGACFRVCLPRAPETGQALQAYWALVVDDEPRLISYYERLVAAVGLEVCSCLSVEEALEAMMQRGQPTIVITDLQIGMGSGEEVIAAVRQRFGSSVPILVITGIRDSVRTNDARASGATDVIFKPIGQRALYARIESSIPRKRGTGVHVVATKEEFDRDI